MAPNFDDSQDELLGDAITNNQPVSRRRKGTRDHHDPPENQRSISNCQLACQFSFFLKIKGLSNKMWWAHIVNKLANKFCGQITRQETQNLHSKLCWQKKIEQKERNFSPVHLVNFNNLPIWKSASTLTVVNFWLLLPFSSVSNLDFHHHQRFLRFHNFYDVLKCVVNLLRLPNACLAYWFKNKGGHFDQKNSAVSVDIICTSLIDSPRPFDVKRVFVGRRGAFFAWGAHS